MACKGFLECLLKLFNFLLTIVGLAIVGYGIYLFVHYKMPSSSDDETSISPTAGAGEGDLLQLCRPMLAMAISLSPSIFDNLPKAWFIYLLIGVGVVLFIISCFGCIGALTRIGCCLSFYSILIIVLILVELGCTAFVYFDKSWKDELPTDSTGDFTVIYDFLKENWEIVKWVALGVVVLEAVLFVLALLVRAANRLEEYDSDDDDDDNEFISPIQARQPLLNKAPSAASSVSVAGAFPDQRPTRKDAWTTRMREKYGLNTSEFSYSPESDKHQEASQIAEERSRCTIM